ncbi:MAG: TolC family protein, partial [Myxococcales bacterium]|nr:TolC family protein [Myxococcales bacterium]
IRAYLDLDDLYDVVEPPHPGEPTLVLDELISLAQANRPEMEGYRLSSQLHEQQLEEVRAGWWPVISAQAQAVMVRESAFSGSPFSWNIGVNLNWHIWDGGLRLSRRDSLEMYLNQDDLNAEAARRRIETEVRQAYMRYQSQSRIMPSVENEARLAQLSHTVNSQALEIGGATALEVETALNNLYLAQLAEANASTELLALLYELYRVTGQMDQIRPSN